jgi:hypothetical protein
MIVDIVVPPLIIRQDTTKPHLITILFLQLLLFRCLCDTIPICTTIFYTLNSIYALSITLFRKDMSYHVGLYLYLYDFIASNIIKRSENK